MARWNKKLTFEKDPDDVVDYTLNFKGLLQADAINTATATDANGVVSIDSTTVSGNNVTVFVSGGTANSTAKIEVTITTTNATPRTFERSFYIQVLDL